jgi:hypothetical protein
MKLTVAISMLLVSVPLFACAVENADAEPPEVSDSEGVGPRQIITSINADGVWTASAQRPTIIASYVVEGSAVFAGPAGKTRRMGVCLLNRASGDPGSAWKACTTVADCASYPAVLPPGGFRYCSGENGGATKKCYYRSGPPAAYCAGTPANGGVEVAPGTYTTPQISSVGFVISYACFEGCLTTDPSSSSVGKTVDPGGGHS